MGRASPSPTGHSGTCLTTVAVPRLGPLGLGSQEWELECLGPDLQEPEKDPALTVPTQLSFLHTGFLCLRSENLLVFALGITVLGVCHYTLTVKGSHLATHGALTESKRWSKIWMLFFVEVRLGRRGSSRGYCVCTVCVLRESPRVCPRGQLQLLVCGPRRAAGTPVCACLCVRVHVPRSWKGLCEESQQFTCGGPRSLVTHFSWEALAHLFAVLGQGQ